MDLALMQRVLPFFLEAAWATLYISVLSLLLGFSVAAVLVAGRLSNLLVARCLSRVYVSVRGDSIRVSPHLYNTPADIERLFATLTGALDAGS